MSTRTDLLNLIYGQSSLPTTTPTVYAESSPPVALTGAASVSRLETNPAGIGINKAYYYTPSTSNGKALVVNQGHTTTLGELGIAEVCQVALDGGYHVCLVGMPGRSGNGGPTDHNSYTSLRPFIEPATAVMNYLESLGFDDIAMTGLSGGGWATTVQAAIDERIGLSIPVAGTLPWALRTNGSLGDWEQKKLLDVCDYPALYALGCTNGRTQTQVLNRNDPGCFSRSGTNGAYGTTYRAFVAEMVNAVASLDGGEFEFIEDVDNTTHSVSAWTRNSIIGPRLGLNTPLDLLIDDGDYGLTTAGSWALSYGGQGTQSDVSYPSPNNNDGTAIASWLFRKLTAGTYTVKASFTRHTNRATNAPYVVKQAGSTLLSATVNQYGTTNTTPEWVTLGNVTISAGDVLVQLSNAGTNGYVIADAVRITRV